jgi:cytochrome c oxidase assembly protein subunit 15
MANNKSSSASPWPHRLAVALACATFPLVWVGGLVTTTGAGMSVPDWPNTYGYNMFLYPWQTWLAGPWDIIVEHGHRLLATAVGLLTIALVAALWWSDRRRWVGWLGVAALMLVVFQGVLGGLRVTLAERTLAMLHGFTGPLFFALTVAIAVVTSRSWRRSVLLPLPPGEGRGEGYLRPLAVLAAALFYLQIMVGAGLRHVPLVTEPTTFTLAVELHLLLAAVLLALVAMINWSVLRHVRGLPLVVVLAAALGGMTVLQIALGAATWVAKYATPLWLDRAVGPGRLAIEADGWLQTNIVTAHVAVGSLLLGTSVALALYALRAAAWQTAAPAAFRAREVSA